ncbi:Glyoxalase [Bacillus mycoides]|uniref:Glyoxalase n=7 Tax=Bacillus cereus group TaxID=86661 RepID=C2XWB5_BACMY|nr:Glyoxalase [Bacillus mycoides]
MKLKDRQELDTMIKGFGGIFWRTKNLDVIKKWYSEVLKIEIENWNGTVIKPELGTETIFSFFAENDSYFPTEQQVMLNFQVHNLNETIQHLEQIGVPLEKKEEISEFGKFIWIKDPEGRLIELWEK